MGTVTVVAVQARRRWAVVAAAALGLAALPAVVSAVPVSAPATDVARLAARVQASTNQPYQGYAESTGTAGLPALPQLGHVADLLNGDTRLRVWYASANRWRVDVIGIGSERDTYQTPAGQVIWDYGRNQLTELDGTPPVRLPRGADLTPPELARRLLSLAGDQVRLAPLPERPGMSIVDTDPSNIVEALQTLTFLTLPERLAGQPRAAANLTGVATYGTGLARFVVVPVPRRTGFDAMRRATRGGGR